MSGGGVEQRSEDQSDEAPTEDAQRQMGNLEEQRYKQVQGGNVMEPVVESGAKIGDVSVIEQTPTQVVEPRPLAHAEAVQVGISVVQKKQEGGRGQGRRDNPPLWGRLPRPGRRPEVQEGCWQG